MLCQRALEILESVRNRTEIKCSADEISILIKSSYVKEYVPKILFSQLDYELNNLKNNYLQLNSEVRELYKEIITKEREIENFSIISKIFSYLRLGRGWKYKKEVSKIKKELEIKNLQVTSMKDQILRLNSDKKSIQQMTKVNGKSVVLTPLGDLMINEIKARVRFLGRELEELVHLLEKIDDEFTYLIGQVGSIMHKSTFSAIWAVYALNLNMTNLITVFNLITNSSYDYKSSESRMMKLSLSFMKNPSLQIPNSIASVYAIESQTNQDYQNYNPEYNIMKILENQGATLRDSNTTCAYLGSLFSIWATMNNGDVTLIEYYISNLNTIIDTKLLSTLPGDERIYAALLLALSEDTTSYPFFYDLLHDIPQGAGFFASIASLFPWDTQETWMLLVRAESNILRAQSAKFIPELVEYALLLMMNPRILSINNDLSSKIYNKWRTLTIPIVHLLTYSYLEKDLEVYVRRRPLAYIISPRYYVYSSLHYHVIG